MLFTPTEAIHTATGFDPAVIEEVKDLPESKELAAALAFNGCLSFTTVVVMLNALGLCLCIATMQYTLLPMGFTVGAPLWSGPVAVLAGVGLAMGCMAAESRIGTYAPWIGMPGWFAMLVMVAIAAGTTWGVGKFTGFTHPVFILTLALQAGFVVVGFKGVALKKQADALVARYKLVMAPLVADNA